MEAARLILRRGVIKRTQYIPLKSLKPSGLWGVFFG